jgi:GNAT superfamily N-acetyltransferase
VIARLAELAEIPLLNEVEADASQVFLAVPDFAFVAQYPLPDEDAYVPFITERRAFVCEFEAGIAGFVLMGEVDGNGHIFQVSVRAGLQRRGVGRLLIAAGETWARQQGHRAVTLTTFRDVPWNAPAYERLGYAFMEGGTAGPMLSDILDNERALGLFRQVRVAMLKRV